MRLTLRTFAVSILLSASTALLAQQQPPTVLHAQFSTQAVEHGLAAAIDQLKRSGSPLWAGYAIPVEPHFHVSNGAGISFLEESNHLGTEQHSKEDTVSANYAIVLLRLAGGNVEKLRVENVGRQLDAGGLRFVWLTGVTPGDSVRTLRSLAVTGGPEALREAAVFVLSLHQAPEATPALAALAAPDNPLAIREKAAFWLANQRGRDGFLVLKRLAHDDPDPAFRERLTFDLTLSKQPEALDELIRMAHSDPSPEVRRKAQFWMATTGGKKVAADLQASAETDPNAAVRKSAVFALARLPGDEAASQLIQLARTSHDGEVRKQAVFWLGQSQDPRALAYLTELITH